MHLRLRKCEKLPQSYCKLADLRLRNTSCSFAELNVNLRCPALVITVYLLKCLIIFWIVITKYSIFLQAIRDFSIFVCEGSVTNAKVH